MDISIAKTRSRLQHRSKIICTPANGQTFVTQERLGLTQPLFFPFHPPSSPVSVRSGRGHKKFGRWRRQSFRIDRPISICLSSLLRVMGIRSRRDRLLAKPDAFLILPGRTEREEYKKSTPPMTECSSVCLFCFIFLRECCSHDLISRILLRRTARRLWKLCCRRG